MTLSDMVISPVILDLKQCRLRDQLAAQSVFLELVRCCLAFLSPSGVCLLVLPIGTANTSVRSHSFLQAVCSYVSLYSCPCIERSQGWCVCGRSVTTVLLAEDCLLKKFLRVGVITKSELIDSVNAMIAENGLEVFDLELPTGSQGVFRVFLCLLGGVCQGITHEHCSEVARKISYDPRFEWLLNKYSMEVSSPGVNRKLKSASQFKNAIGERVKCTADIAIGDVADNERRTFTGELLRADDKEIEVKLEEPLLGKEVIVVSLRNIARARVDFLF